MRMHQRYAVTPFKSITYLFQYEKSLMSVLGFAYGAALACTY